MEINYSRIYKNCEKYGGGYLRRGFCKKPKLWADPLDKKPLEYAVKPLIEAAEASISASDDFWHYAPTGRFLTGKEEVEYSRYQAVDSKAGEMLDLMCAACGVDAKTLYAVVKSFRRYNQYHAGWNFSADIYIDRNRKAETSFRRAVMA